MKNKQELLKLKKDKLDYIIKNFPNVVGVGVSEKETNGKKLGNLALTVYVQKKISPSALTEKQRIDKDSFVMRDLDSLDFDIKEIGFIKKLSAKTRIRPVEVGVSEGHVDVTAGTGGVLVTDTSGSVFRVSNNHIYAMENAAKIGDPILQPAPYDGGRLQDKVGVLSKFIPINMNLNGINEVDCAMRTTLPEEKNTVYKTDIKPKFTRHVLIGDTVTKMGRTTSLTTNGKVVDDSMTLSIWFDGGDIWFDNQILIESNSVFSQGGDSGSPIFRRDIDGDAWVGLLFAGSESGRYTIANHANKVEQYLGVKLLTAEEDKVVEEPHGPVTETPKNKLPWVFGVIVAFIFGVYYLIQKIF
jgi:hypothetical protein